MKTITKSHAEKLEPIKLKMNKMLSNDPRRKPLDRDYEFLVSQWKSKIENIGAQVTGLWQVEFDLGEGCLAWRYPELNLSYFRVHGDSFKERVKLQHYIEEMDPDWAN